MISQAPVGGAGSTYNQPKAAVDDQEPGQPARQTPPRPLPEQA